MPLPLPSRSSKPETKKSQSSKIVPSDHGQSEKRGENYQAKISSCSPKRRCKKRSAFEDLTNASQSQPAQLKKESNKEFVKDVSKKIKGNTAALGLAKNNEMNKESYKLEPSPVVVSTALVPNIMEKPLILEIPTISKTTTTEEVAPLEDIDKNHSDPFFNPIYAKDIFSYMKEREEKFILKKYMNRQTDISSCMRAILVDWLVEVQMTFEMSHETLYLAVKLVDHYLMEVVCKRDKLQLLGSTAFLIAAKFEESYPPCVDDFLYICDDIYQRDEMLTMEISILQTLKFDINIPIAYHFLRRYARCLRANMKTLTLSRFICEMTLQEYDYVQEKASKLAAGSFLLALYMKKLGHWAPALEYYSGYKTSDLHPLVKQLNTLLTLRPCNKLKTVHSKYSHQVFFEVTKIPPLDMLKLEKILNYC
uniref:G2/mitotic-specific cyclin-B3-like isoform X1 n=1 Tax=Callorhinus ursinus TaxID=34884 RepID=A0A3Q7R6F7_CALUR|nr:G2/mitotic-specific cyclin-B3-like isoform X1 [Callorhinus ursinus]